MTRAWRAVPPLAAALLAVTAACRHKPVGPEPVPADSPPAMPAIDSAAIRDSIARAQAAEAEAARRRADEMNAAERERRVAEARAALLAPIYFDFDRADLGEDARLTLDAKVPVLMANPGLRLRVSGNTDARGSDEYNVALGQRRASMAREYLAQHGIDPSRLAIVSYGEERPSVIGEDEGAWAQNRRAEFEVVAGELVTPGET